MWRHFQALILLILFTLTELTLQSKTKAPNSKPRTFGPCQTCRMLVNSFFTVMVTSKFSPEVTPSPEQSENVTLSQKDNDEILFEEILKNICSDVKSGKEQCAELAAAHSDLLKEYWKERKTIPDLELISWLCIDKLKVCCPYNHFGRDCSPCPGFPDDICSGHGKCKGNGTRKGNGGCNCEKEYIGPTCNDCAKMHYEAYRDETKLLCAYCHRSCAGGCRGPGPRNCDACKEGWETDDERGCLDMNECLMKDNACGKNEFCVNTDGSYACFDCDRSCNGCSADGPDMCDKCAKGYILVEKVCINYASQFRAEKVDYTRYLTYFGLCVSTCIIFQKNVMIASVIGILVGIYIATSEYLLSEQP